MIKIFMGGGVVDGQGEGRQKESGRGFEVRWWRVGIIEGSFRKHLKTRGG